MLTGLYKVFDYGATAKLGNLDYDNIEKILYFY
jgi:hypothetical protein